MINTKDDSIGRVSTDVELANYDDLALARRGVIPPEQVRRLTVNGVVDTGATFLVIPEDVARQLGLPIVRRTKVSFADGRSTDRPVAGSVYLSWGGRSDVFSAIVEPGRDSVLLGAIVMEALDLVVDCGRQQLAPRDPEQTTAYIE